MMRLLLASLLLAALASPAEGASSGVPLSPRAASVEGGQSRTFSVRFSPAVAGESVTFSNDACGTFPGGLIQAQTTTDASGAASMTFTADASAGITCWLRAQAGAAVVEFDVLTYRLSQVTVVAETVPASPTLGEAFTLNAAVALGAHRLKEVEVAARVIPGAGSATLAPSAGSTGQSGSLPIQVTPTGAGSYDVEILFRGLTKRLSLRDAAAVSYQDMWWSGAAENGWGMSIIHDGDTLFATIFAYDEAGQPVWFVLPSGSWNATRTVYSGAAYLPRGSPYFAYDAESFVPGAPIGQITLTFAGPDEATLDYVIGGLSGRKRIVRHAFAPPGTVNPGHAALAGLWWGGPAQNGWGITIIHQNDTLFSVWYTYDASGRATWFPMPGGSWTGTNTYEGRVYRTVSSPWLGVPYDASALRVTDVGSYRLRFETGQFEYSIEGRTGVNTIQKHPLR